MVISPVTSHIICTIILVLIVVNVIKEFGHSECRLWMFQTPRVTWTPLFQTSMSHPANLKYIYFITMLLRMYQPKPLWPSVPENAWRYAVNCPLHASPPTRWCTVMIRWDKCLDPLIAAPSQVMSGDSLRHLCSLLTANDQFSRVTNESRARGQYAFQQQG